MSTEDFERRKISEPRPAIMSIAESANGDRAEVTITLSWADAAFRGVATGSPALASRPRLIGEATLRAVEGVLGGRITLSLAGMATQELGPVQVAMAHITIDVTGESLVGTAVVDGGDVTRASVKAVLDALNRRMGRLV